MTELLHADITNKIWRAYYNVYNAHGHDYPEEFYEEMMHIELNFLQVECATQVEYEIFYKGSKVGVHLADMEVADAVTLEFKVVPKLLPRHYAQLVSNLKVSGHQVGLLLNFGGDKPEGARRVLTDAHRMPAPVWQPTRTAPNLLFPDLTLALRRVIWSVYNELGNGYVYRIYANAMNVEMQLQGIARHRFRKLAIVHRGRDVGTIPFQYFVVDDKVVFVPVAQSKVGESEFSKLRVVLRLHGLHLGMIANFANERLEIKYVRGEGRG